MSVNSKEVYIVRTKVTANFTTLPNSIFRDDRLSWGAIGLLSFLLHLPPTFKLKFYNLGGVKKGVSGKHTTRTALKLLELAGYVKVIPERDKSGRFKKTTWHVSDIPEVPPPPTDFPDADNPDWENLPP